MVVLPVPGGPSINETFSDNDWQDIGCRSPDLPFAGHKTRYTVQVTGVDADKVPANRRNLMVSAIEAVFAVVGRRPAAVALTINNCIPVGSGLGSSSSAIVSGLAAGNALADGNLSPHELLSMAVDMEGHPDNVAPAIMGSLVCSFTPQGELPNCIRYNVNPNLRFVTVILPYEVKTEEARKIVPQEVPLSTAVWQMGRISGLTRGLESGDVRLIAAACDDKIQEPYRRELIWT